ncbi:conserved repeat domain-containing protein [Spirosomataceae bacterium TFI 002]|nr:conserved repeat domain-containing protein [Spirosomataceae bacterium TFI 002]
MSPTTTVGVSNGVCGDAGNPNGFGSVRLQTVADGIGPFTYNITSDCGYSLTVNSSNNDTTFSNLPRPCNYTFNVTDGCSTTSSNNVTLVAPGPDVITCSSLLLCPSGASEEYRVRLTVSARPPYTPTANYTYTVTDSISGLSVVNTTSSSTSLTTTGLPAGKYYLNITDACGATCNDSIVIGTYMNPTVSVDGLNACAGAGQANVIGINNQSTLSPWSNNYTYRIINPSASRVNEGPEADSPLHTGQFSSLVSEGSYTFSFNDGCKTVTTSLTIPSYEQPSWEVGFGALCPGDATADLMMVNLQPAGQIVGPYTWRLVGHNSSLYGTTPPYNGTLPYPNSNGQTDSTFAGLPAQNGSGATATYNFQGVDGCKNSYIGSGKVGALPAISLILDKTKVCADSSGTLRARPSIPVVGASYVFLRDGIALDTSTTLFTNISPAIPGNYEIRVYPKFDTDLSCSVSDMELVSTSGDLILTDSTITCITPSINLNDLTVNSSPGTFSFYSDNSYITPVSSPTNVTTPGTYYIEYVPTGDPSCILMDSLVIAIDTTKPTPIITSTATELNCNVTSIDLTATGGDSYLWSTGATTAMISVTDSATYTLTAMNANGCTASTSIQITKDADLPTPVINSPATELTCNLTSIDLTATGGDSYLWSTGATTAMISVTDSATYTVTAMNANGCTVSTSIQITKNADLPTPIITSPATELTCNLTSIDLTATGGDSYLWSTGATTAMISVTDSATYTVTALNANGCTASTSIQITKNADLPTPIITSPATELTCNLTSIDLTATGGDSYLWSTGATTAMISVTDSATYTVTAMNANGCTVSTSIQITKNADLPTPIITSTATELTCNLTSIDLTATGGDSYLWSTGATTAMISVTDSANYTVTALNANGCTASTSIQITKDADLPTPVITSTATELTCNITSIDLTATGGDSYLWSTGATTAMISVTDSATYSVTAMNANGCTASASIQITKDADLPTPVITSPATELTCNVTSIDLIATGGGSYLWSTGATTAMISVTDSATYTVTAMNANGCTASTSIQLTKDADLPTPVITSMATELTCNVTSIDLTATGGDSYLWSTGATTAMISVTDSASYTVTAMNANGCTASTSIQLTKDADLPTPVITSTATELTCNVTSIDLTATGGDSYLWSTGATTAMISVTDSATYTVTAINANGCTASTSIQITKDADLPTPVITSTATELTCNVTSIDLTATGGDSYLWSTGATTAMISVTDSATYTVTAMNANGCTASTSIQITKDADLPTPVITSTATELTCNVTSIDLIATGGGSYLWSTGATTAMISVTDSATYTVTAMNANGCTASTSIQITKDADLPTPVISSTATELTCNVTSIDLTATGGDSYLWSTGATTAMISVTDSATYSVTAMNANGCTASTSIQITKDADLPTPVITSTATELNCNVTSIDLTATGGDSYLWSTGATTAMISVSDSATYTVTAMNANGCTASTSIQITKDADLPTPVITSTATELNCNVTSIDLTATGGDSYLWSTGATTALISVSDSATYTVTAMNANGCTASTSIQITKDADLPTPIITSTATELNCNVTSIDLTATGGDSYLWSTGATTALISVSDSATYTVTAMNANGCTASTSIQITKDADLPTPIITSTATELTCNLTSIDLTATGGDSYLWSTGATTAMISVTDSATYTVTAMNANGCTASASIQIMKDADLPTPVITSTATELNCNVTSIDLTATGGDSYLWSTGATTAMISVTDSATYTVTAMNANGCTATSQVHILKDIAVLNLEIADTLCLQNGSSYSLNFTNNSGTTVTASHGLINGNTISNIPSGLDVEIYITDGNCTDTLLINYSCSIPFGSIGSTVFEDNNGNGQQDAGDAGIPGVKVYLLSQSGSTLDSTLTNSSGAYSFDSLTSGTYRVFFDLPGGSVFTQANNGDDTSDSDANPNTGLSSLITIDTSLPPSDLGRNNLTVFAGIVLAPEYDLAVFKSVNNASPSLGDIITYTVLLVNEGNTTISDIQVLDSLQSGLQLLNYASSSGTYTAASGIWNTPIIHAGDTATLAMTVKVNCRGVILNTAEIVSMGTTDRDSSPNNQVITEDDIDNVCISVIYEVCPVQNLPVSLSIPSGLGTYQWFLNGDAIPSATNSRYETISGGSYTVEVNGIGYTSCAFTVVENCICKPVICAPFLINKTK